MAHARQEFALVGYSQYLERRPLKFVETIPAARICSACGNVPRSMFYLLCGHTLCEPCYESCDTTSECVCPLDGDVCATAGATRKEYPAENLLDRQVHCWNEANGCCVILPASLVAEHVRQDCQHHVTRCVTCLATVLSRDVCAHLKSRCTALVLHAAAEPQQVAEDTEMTHLQAFERKVEERVRKLEAKLAQLSLESGSQNDKLVDLSHNVNGLRESLAEQVALASIQTRDHFDRNAAEMRELYLGQSNSLGSVITSALASVVGGEKKDKWVLTGYATHKDEAVRKGWSFSWSDKVYLRGYLMSWGIKFEKHRESVYLTLCLQLYKGKNDDSLDWPFKNELKLSIIHPDTRRERHLRVMPEVSQRKKWCFRQTEGSSAFVNFAETKVESSDIEHDDYVRKDELLLKIEVLL